MKGIKASPGIAIGRAYLLVKNVDVSKKEIIDTDYEIKRFESAIKKSKKQLEKIGKEAKDKVGEKTARVFNAHILILKDPEFIPQIKKVISSEKVNAEFAVKSVADKFYNMLSALKGEYLRERASDVRDIGSRIILNLMGVECDLSNLSENTIVVAEDLGPSDTAQFDKDKVSAFVTDEGGRTSHSAVMARIMQIPAVVGLGDITSSVKSGDTLIVDGENGNVIINPDEAVINEYKKKKSEYEKHAEKLKEMVHLVPKTKDGREVKLEANIGTDKDVSQVLANGAGGIGLFRTEFLFMDRDSMPSEEEQFKAYKSAAESMGKMNVTIRTLDIGGDKKLPYLNIGKEDNPFLGFRAIRFCLENEEIFKTQLRAILRASACGNVSIMYPMISDINEVRSANKVLEKAKHELDAENMAYDKNIKVGIMVEIPSSAVCADIFAKEVDFFSIGTNDLTQYTLAADRGNKKVAKYYNYFNPGVLRLIKNCIDESHKYGKFTAMCGEMAGDTEAVKILLGLGLDAFSMSASSIPAVKEAIRSTTYEEAKKEARKALKLD